jgi:hypothetical protein
VAASDCCHRPSPLGFAPRLMPRVAVALRGVSPWPGAAYGGRSRRADRSTTF